MTVLITGGAGFIGSHLIDALFAQGHAIVCVDDLSLGRVENIAHHRGRSSFTFVKFNVLDKDSLRALFAQHQFDCVFHMAANSDIQQGARQVNVDLDNTFLTTFAILECMRDAGTKRIVFASTSAIYGELGMPLHEDVGPLFPISYYGAAKLASEAYISAFCENCGMQAWIARFPNVVGERATHGAMFDFISRLEHDPRTLDILGDGTQKKPYLYVRDLVEGILFIWRHAVGKVNCFNLGVDSATTVRRIAEIVVEEMGLDNVAFAFTGGDRGWVGDVPRFQYDLTKVHALGWKAGRSSDEAVRTAVRAELNDRKRRGKVSEK